MSLIRQYRYYGDYDPRNVPTNLTFEDVISAKQDENMINFPYGTTFTGYIYIKVSSAT